MANLTSKLTNAEKERDDGKQDLGQEVRRHGVTRLRLDETENALSQVR